jgi:hypothetical protein
MGGSPPTSRPDPRRTPLSILWTCGVKYLPDFHYGRSPSKLQALCMRWAATISRYEQRHPASTVGIDVFCRKSHHSRLEHYTTWARRRPNTPHNRCARTQVARPSGRQDSNLRPLVPQTSPHFPMSAEFALEWFCGELVGMTTRARVLESIGIGWNLWYL